jgi:hypothetical protein
MNVMRLATISLVYIQTYASARPDAAITQQVVAQRSKS